MKPFDVYPIFDIEIVKASGSTLWDKNGKTYLDLYGGHAVISGRASEVARMHDIIGEVGADPAAWLPRFHPSFSAT